MLNIKLDKDISKPLYVQLYEKLKVLIESNKLEDDKLPSIRQLAKKIGVNNVTVVSAYKLLEQEGYVYSIKGSGTYIKRIASDQYPYMEERDLELMVSGILPISKDSINFASVSPTPDLFPIDEFKIALNEVLERERGLAFLYPEINGYGPLRESISKYMIEKYKVAVDKDQILITSGGQQGLDIISKTLINQGDSIFVENPTYSAAYAAFKSRGAKIFGIPMEKDGLDISYLETLIAKNKPKFLYLMTNYQSPTTYSYSLEKKNKLLSLANKYDFYIIEDDFLTDLSFENDEKTSLKSLDYSDKVIFIKSFSKIFMPGVRIGFITLPSHLFKDIIKAKHTTDITSSGFLQRSFDLYLRKGFWKKHIDNIKEVYYEKYLLILKELDALKKYGIEFVPPNGGLSLWLRLPEEIDAFQLYKECSENNLSIVPGKVFFIEDNLYSNYIRISYGAVSNEEIIEGIKILQNILGKRKTSSNSSYLPFI